MNFIKNKKLNITLMAIFGVLLVAFILGSIFDFDIAYAIRFKYVSTDPFCVNAPAFAVILTSGIFPTAMFAAFAGACLLFNKYESKFWNIALKLVGIAGVLTITYSTIKSCMETADLYQLTRNNPLLWKILITVFVILIVVGTFLLTMFKTKDIDQNKKTWAALTIFLIIVVYFFTSEFIKYAVSRPRPRAIFAENPTEEYRNWWQARFFYALSLEKPEICKSFLSGHSANVGTYIFSTPLVISVTKYGKKDRNLIIGTIIATLYAFLVGFSRLYAQAHFLSDVSGGMLYVLIISFIVYCVIQIIKPKLEKKIR